nr:hypothetical protein [Tanacetum cinerariifolium]
MIDQCPKVPDCIPQDSIELMIKYTLNEKLNVLGTKFYTQNNYSNTVPKDEVVLTTYMLNVVEQTAKNPITSLKLMTKKSKRVCKSKTQSSIFLHTRAQLGIKETVDVEEPPIIPKALKEAYHPKSPPHDNPPATFKPQEIMITKNLIFVVNSLVIESSTPATTEDETTNLLIYQEPFSRPKGEKLWDYEIPTRIKSVWVNDISSLTQQTKDTKGKKKMLGVEDSLITEIIKTELPIQDINNEQPSSFVPTMQLNLHQVMKVTPNEPSQLLRVEEKRKIELVSKKEVLRIINDEARASDLAIKNAEEFKQLQLQELNAAKEKQKAKVEKMMNIREDYKNKIEYVISYQRVGSDIGHTKEEEEGANVVELLKSLGKGFDELKEQEKFMCIDERTALSL